MSKRERLLIVALVIITFGFNVYKIQYLSEKTDEMHQCAHQLAQDSASIHKGTERNLKEIQYAVSNSEDGEKLQLIEENSELRWQNEKLIRDMLNMFNLFRGRDIPLVKPSGKTNV